MIDASSPTIAAVSPTSGVNTGSVSITSITGSAFQSGATVKLTRTLQTDIVGSGFSFTSSTQINGGTFNINGALAGAWNVVVTNPDSQTGTLSNGFTVNNPAPTVTAISPFSGYNVTSTSITSITGTGFKFSTTVKLSQTGQSDIAGSGFSVASSTQINGGTFDLTGMATGTWNVVATNGDGQYGTLTNGFTVNATPPITVTAISPNIKVVGGGCSVSVTSITGTGFSSKFDLTVQLTGPTTITGTSFTVASSTQINGGTFTCGAAGTTYNVVVTNGSTGTLTNGFTFTK